MKLSTALCVSGALTLQFWECISNVYLLKVELLVLMSSRDIEKGSHFVMFTLIIKFQSVLHL